MNTKRKTSKPKPLTEDQSRLIQEFGLDAATVSFKKPGAALPCEIIIQIEREPRRYWVCRDNKTGKAKLEDSKPSFTKPQQEGECAAYRDPDKLPDGAADVRDKVDARNEEAIQRAGIADPDAISHGPTRGEVEAWLKQSGLSQRQRQIVRARHFEAKSTRAIAVKVGKSKTWVAKTLKRPSVQQCLKTLQSGEPLMPRGGKGDSKRRARKKPLPPLPLMCAMLNARVDLDNYLSPKAADAGYMASGLSELNLPADPTEQEKAVATIILWPPLLLHPKAGPWLVERLAELLTAARYGKKKDATAARKTLKALTHYRQGNRYPIPDHILGSAALAICVTVSELQRAWRARRSERPSESREARVEAIRKRKQFRAVVERFSNQELLPVLQSDLLTASARLAERATGVDSRSFIRAWRRLPEIVELLQQSSGP